MNRPILISTALAAALAVSCGGKVIVDGLGQSGAGGAGGSGSSSSSKASGTTTSSTHASSSVAVASSSTGQMTTGSGSTCDPKYTCAEAVTPPAGDPKKLCVGSNSEIDYEVLLKCTCGGPCAAACGANSCIGQAPSPSCIGCIQNPQKGCGKEFQSCVNN